MEEVTIPVAYCFLCEAYNPVVVEQVPTSISVIEFTAIYCPICDSVINMDGDVEVNHYTPEELEKMGWKVNES